MKQSFLQLGTQFQYIQFIQLFSCFSPQLDRLDLLCNSQTGSFAKMATSMFQLCRYWLDFYTKMINIAIADIVIATPTNRKNYRVLRKYLQTNWEIVLFIKTQQETVFHNLTYLASCPSVCLSVIFYILSQNSYELQLSDFAVN